MGKRGRNGKHKAPASTAGPGPIGGTAMPPSGQPPIVQIGVITEAGFVRMSFGTPIEWIRMTANDALYLASLLRMRAERLIDATEGGIVQAPTAAPSASFAPPPEPK